MMTDDLQKPEVSLVKRLRDCSPLTIALALQAADRIEALELGRETLVQAHDAMVEILRQSGRKRIAAEARLAECEARLSKAVEALRLYACACDGGFCHANENFCGWTATAVLAEIEGGKKDE